MKHSGKSIDDEIFGALEKQMTFFEKQEKEDGLISIAGNSQWWCFIDWADIVKEDKVVSLNCIYYQAVCCYIEILNLCGKDAHRYETKRIRLQQSIQEKMFDKQRGLFADSLVNGKLNGRFSQQTNIYAVISNVYEEKNKEILNRIFHKDFDGVRVNGAFMLCLTVDCLYENGLMEECLLLIRRYWGEMLRRGATTWWETFDMNTSFSAIPYAFTKNNATYLHEYIPVSHCHGWGAGVAFTLSKAKKAGKL